MAINLDIVGFGSIAVDSQLFVDQPLAAGKGRVMSMQTDYGGNVATALITAATLGMRTGFIGWLSDHPDDEHVIRNLHENGVQTTCASFSIDARPVTSTIVVDRNGDRFIAYCDDHMFRAAPVFSATDFSQAKILLIDSYAVESIVQVSLAIASGMTVVADIEWIYGEATSQLSDLCHHLIVPWDYAREVTNSIEPKVMLERLWSAHRSAVVITRGEQGAYYRDVNDIHQVWHQPAFDVEVQDTTGCGDCFHGAYSVGLIRGYDARQCVRFASAAAAIAASGKGGQAAVLSVLPDAIKQKMEMINSPKAYHLR